ncbi:MAG: excinuclease ABC subunit C [Candidatus Portnoybacteria bacterium CG10_big_fil_rev_8_21_14_0_10_44_7]|uniref:Excinuclease ABC subunit C n=1 Tax=Candidatus Portnoybacteria bacterium CG10_big_fil_rev_8_21_14_0_10_44_7 TaxID=1974816 RepID=A0A2M8KIM3_9BACT|nr:MAG: excinuclease ABC subunit C [Candidatus Portnoybacteria bacterium CG10_big_fil_rev_8_21_14_0_10_44_7]
MFYVYLLESQKDYSVYIGFTTDLKTRFKDHNNGKSRYTKNRRPWQLIYYEAYANKKDARQREIKLKRHNQQKEILLKRIINSRHKK